MIQMQTMLDVADNSGARSVMCDFVEIRECRPVAKTIAWTLVSVIEKAE